MFRIVCLPRIVCLLIVLAVFPGTLLARDLIPDRRAILSQGIDFYGSDLATLRDTDFRTCQKACLYDRRCKAFTYNARSKACFPKSAVNEQRPYTGAISGRVVDTPPAVKARAEMRAEQADFLRESDLAAARELADTISMQFFPEGRSALQLAAEARTLASGGRTLAALRLIGKGIVLTDEAAFWADFSDLARQLKPDDMKALQKLRIGVLPVAVNAWLRSDTPEQQARALRTMALAFEAAERGRDMIPALVLAQKIMPDEATARLLEHARARYGFRVVEDTVNSDAVVPRICAVFSEKLVQGGFDYVPYLKLPDTDMPLEVSGRQLCVGGLDHGQRYEITFREGLPAASGETLNRSVTIRHYVRDRSPLVRFPGRGYVLPRAADAALPVETVNLRQVELVLHRISDRNLQRTFQNGYFGRPLGFWQQEQFASDIAEEVWRGTGEVKMELNREVTTRLPMGGIIADLPPGIYALEARVPGADPYENPASMQWFVLSDLGLASMKGADGVHVFVRGLANALPVEGAEITLVSRANAILAEARTDAGGYVHFPAAITQGTGSKAPALIIAREADRDIAFLSLTDPAFDLSDRGVEGRPPAGAIDAFLTTERGVYRAGDTVHVTALLRDGHAEAIEGLPVTAILRRPDGIEYSRRVSHDDRAGGYVFTFPIGETAQRGSWRLALHADPDAPPIATTKFLVEDFIPERIDFELKLPEGPLRFSDSSSLMLEARYLFGAPAADLTVEGEVRIVPRKALETLPGYRFGRHDIPFSPVSESLPAEFRTDRKGKVEIPVVFPEADAASRLLEARFTVRVSEGSGRPVERQIVHPLAPVGPLIGIRPLFDDVVPEGGEARFEILSIGPDEKPIPMKLRWTVNRVHTRYQWYQYGGQWQWEPVTTRELVKSAEVEFEGDAPLEIGVPVEWGGYEIRVEQLGGDHVSSSLGFSAGWYAAADVSATPDVLELSLDKPAYRPGETATLRLVPRHAGRALITVMSNRLIDMKTIEVSKGENLVELPVTDEWGAGAYVMATVIRPMDVSAGRNPARALGLSYAQVDPGDHRLAVRFEVPPEAQPRQPLEVALRVNGLRSEEEGHAVIAAVDLGILNLTDFGSPDPAGHYFGQRRLGMELRDLYGRLIDGMNGSMGRVRSGGDAGSDARLKSPPPMKKLVTFFSGPVRVDKNGMARVRFDLPAFNGTLRLMAVAWSKTGVGNASTDVLVRDPVVLSASLPQFLAPGDQSRLLLEITHADGPAGEVELKVSSDGIALDQSRIPAKITLREKETARIPVPIVARRPGEHEIAVHLVTPDGTDLEERLAISVIDNDPVIARTSRFELAAGDTFTFSRDVFAGLRPGTGHVILAFGPLARLDVPGLLNALDNYPYGCSEQITSKALPLLYLSDVAGAMGLGARGDMDARIDQAIEKVLNNQSPNGAFGLWRPDQGDMWLDAYVSDFLSRARAGGHHVPQVAFRNAMDNLRNQVNYYGDFDEGGEDLAYALMVLAREGAAAIGDLRYYADVKAKAFSTPLAAAQLGAALSHYGDQARADRMFARAAEMISMSVAERESHIWRADYGTVLRDAAGALALATEARSTVIDRDMLIDRLNAGTGQPRSTQEAAWALLAAGALVADPMLAGISIDGVPVEIPLVRVLEEQTEDAPLVVRNDGGRSQILTLTAFGVPESPEPARGYGYTIERHYYTMNGTEVDITAPEGIPAGTRLVAVVTVRPHGKREARLIISDPLPAGFEIDNPNLLAGGDVRALDWLEPAVDEVRHSEARSDRFVAAVDWLSDKPLQLAYIVRAVSPGVYHQPAASVEDMYRPVFRAHDDAARVRVTERNP